MMNISCPTVFLCYAKEDRKKVQDLYQQLRSAGMSPWMDKPPRLYKSEGIAPGEDWELLIREAMESADFCLAFLSGRSISKKGYLQREFRKAMDIINEMPDRKAFLIPVLLDPCSPPAIQVGGVSLKRIQWYRLYEEGSSELLDFLAQPRGRATGTVFQSPHAMPLASGMTRQKRRTDIQKPPGGGTLSLYRLTIKDSKVSLSKDALTQKYSDHPIMLQTRYALEATGEDKIRKIKVAKSILGLDQMFTMNDKLLIPQTHFHPKSRAYKRFLEESGLPTLEEAVFAGNYPVPSLSPIDEIEMPKPRSDKPKKRFDKKALYVWTGSEGLTPNSPVLRKLKLNQNLTFVDHVYIGGGTGWSESNETDVCVVLTSTPRKSQSETHYNAFYDNYRDGIYPNSCEVHDLSGGSRAQWEVRFRASGLSDNQVDYLVDKIIEAHTTEITRIRADISTLTTGTPPPSRYCDTEITRLSSGADTRNTQKAASD